jgi:hypothetical protein
MYRNFSARPERWREYFVEFQDRIVFGTDNVTPRAPCNEAIQNMIDKVRMIRQFLETSGVFEGFGTATSRHVTGIGLEQEALEKIYSRNFERYAGTLPRPVNVEAALRHCRRIMRYARGASGQAALRREMGFIETALESNHEPRI